MVSVSRDPLVRGVPQDPRVLTAQLGPQDPKDSRVPPVALVLQEILVPQDQSEDQDHRVNLVGMVFRERQGPLVLLVLLVYKDREVIKDLWGLSGRSEPQALMVCRDSLGARGSQASEDLQGRRVRQAIRDSKDHKDLLVTEEPVVYLV